MNGSPALSLLDIHGLSPERELAMLMFWLAMQLSALGLRRREAVVLQLSAHELGISA